MYTLCGDSKASELQGMEGWEFGSAGWNFYRPWRIDSDCLFTQDRIIIIMTPYLQSWPFRELKLEGTSRGYRRGRKNCRREDMDDLTLGKEGARVGYRSSRIL